MDDISESMNHLRDAEERNYLDQEEYQSLQEAQEAEDKAEAFGRRVVTNLFIQLLGSFDDEPIDLVMDSSKPLDRVTFSTKKGHVTLWVEKGALQKSIDLAKE